MKFIFLNLRSQTLQLISAIVLILKNQFFSLLFFSEVLSLSHIDKKITKYLYNHILPTYLKYMTSTLKKGTLF